MGCCRSDNNVNEHPRPYRGESRRKRKMTRGERTLENMVDEMSHDIEEIQILPSRTLEVDHLSVDDSLTMRYHNRQDSIRRGMMSDDVSELTFGTRKKTSFQYDLGGQVTEKETLYDLGVPKAPKYDLGAPAASPSPIQYDLGASLPPVPIKTKKGVRVILRLKESLKRVDQQGQFSA
jgi:hypothetical protein